MLSPFVLSDVIKHPTRPITSFCIGYTFICAVFESKMMKCAGQKYSFGLSTNPNTFFGKDSSELGNNLPFIDVGTSITIDKIICGRARLCLKLDTGDMKCLGDNSFGSIGIGSTVTPVGNATGYDGDNLPVVELGSGMKVIDVALGEYHTCVIITGNIVKCFGYNGLGQLGQGNKVNLGTLSTQMGDALLPLNLGSGVEPVSIHSTSSSSHTCIILSAPANATQRVKCWGNNGIGQLGYGNYNTRGDAANEMGDYLPLVDFGDESRVKTISVGAYHTCSILINDILKCYGSGSYGVLGLGSEIAFSSAGNSLPAVTLDSNKVIKFLSLGYYYSCLVYDDQIIMKCFGFDNNGQLGQGDKESRGDTPTSMIPFIPAINLGTGSMKIISIATSQNFNCVVYEDSSVKCFGGNDFYQFATGAYGRYGDTPYEMGTNLSYAEFFSPTYAPTRNPTTNPTKSPVTLNPTRNPAPPTRLPTELPTSSPIRQCDYQSAKLCKYDYKCRWKKVDGVRKCAIFDCTDLKQAKCGKERKLCKWNKKTSLCEIKKQE